MFELIILSIVQGITEFLPISSSAHLILAAKHLNFNNENLILDVSLHVGSLLAVIYFFKKEIFNFLKNKFLFSKILVGSLPTIITGFLLVKLQIISELRSVYIIGLTSILFGVVLYFSDRSQCKKKTINNLSIKESIYIGLFQCFSLIPGVSRSGVTLTGARFFKFNRVESAKISFLFSIPILCAVSFYSVIKIIELQNLELTIQNLWALILSFVFSIITLKFFINFLKKFSLIIFVLYRIILGLILIIFYAF